MASTMPMRPGIHLPPLSLPPLMPILALGGPHTPHGAPVVSPHPFLCPSPISYTLATTSPATPRLPHTPRHSHHRHHHQHQSPPVSSPSGSPRINDPTVAPSFTGPSSSTAGQTPMQRPLPTLRPWLAATGEFGPASGLPAPTFAPPGLPLLPCWGSRSMPTSPTSSPPQSPTPEERLRLGVKRKRAASVPPTTEQRHRQQAESVSSHSVKSEVTFANGAQVAKWKLNGPRYKRCRVTDADGADQWKTCQHCGTDSTPEWRNGPLGKGTLCNACGLRYRSKQREQTSRGQSGNVPVSLLLNPASHRKGRTNISNPMIWETKLSSSPPQADLPQLPHAM